MLKDKTVLITGANRGIGRATALLMAENHAQVIVNYRNDESEREAAELVDIMTKKGQKAFKIKADVSSEDEVQKMFEEIKEKYGRLDVLVNNAGIMRSNLLLMTKTEEFNELFETNCKGVFLCMRAAAKIMVKQRYGKIVNLASIVGTNGQRGLVGYAGTKAAVAGMTKSAAKELGMFNVTVNAVAPGFIDTAMTKDLKEEIKKEMVSNIALGRMGKPEDVARVILFLSSELADYVSGQIIGIDGCQTM
jgi:3-oxoacyl-[acyl-carrier protein] reductase